MGEEWPGKGRRLSKRMGRSGQRTKLHLLKSRTRAREVEGRLLFDFGEGTVTVSASQAKRHRLRLSIVSQSLTKVGNALCTAKAFPRTERV